MKVKFVKKLISTETGSTAIEYGLIGALVVIAIIGALTGMSDTFNSNFKQTTSAISKAVNK